MFNFNRLKEKYLEDAAFNKATNLFRSLIEEYGFTPSEIRESIFLAQYMYEMEHVRKFIISDKQREDQIKAIIQLKQNFMLDVDKIMGDFKSQDAK